MVRKTLKNHSVQYTLIIIMYLLTCLYLGNMLAPLMSILNYNSYLILRLCKTYEGVFSGRAKDKEKEELR